MFDSASCETCANCTIFEDTVNGCHVCSTCGAVATGYTSHDVLLTDLYLGHTAKHVPTALDFPPRPKCEIAKRTHTKDLFELFEIISDDIVGPVQELTVEYYTSYVAKHPARGSLRKGLFACCLYRAFAAFSIHRSLKEISAFTNMPRGALTKANKMIGIVLTSPAQCDDVNLLQSAQLIRRMCDRLDVSESDRKIIKQKCTRLDKKLSEDEYLKEMTPVSIAAGVIAYICSQNSICSVQHIGSALAVSTITIDKIIKCLKTNYKM